MTTGVRNGSQPYGVLDCKGMVTYLASRKSDGFNSHMLHYGHVVLDAVTVENPQGCLEFDSPHVHLSTNSNFKEDGLDCKSKNFMCLVLL